jgi:uncharacterized RDD family membrane protein YckC
VEAPQKLDTLQSIELAEGVQIHLHPAGPMPRALALIADYVIAALMFAGICLVLLFAARMLGGEMSIGLALLAAFTTYWGYFMLYEVLRRGQTPGKKWMGLRVVRTSGAPVGWGAAFLRNLVRFADMMPLLPQWQLAWLVFGFYLFGVTSCLCTRRFQRLGDLVADTVVIYDRPDADFTAKLRVDLKPAAPGFVLTREEQVAFVQFAERAATWSDSRKEELVKPLAEVLGVEGRNGVVRALEIGSWLRDS